MESALIKDDDLNNLPRFRRRSNINVEKEVIIGNDSSNPEINNRRQYSNILRPDVIATSGDLIPSRSVDIKIEVDNLNDRNNTANHDSYTGDWDGNDFDREDDFYNTPKHEEPIKKPVLQYTDKTVKRGRGRPRKVIKDEDIPATPKLVRKRGRPRKGEESTIRTSLTPRRSSRNLTKETPNYRIEKLDAPENTKVTKPQILKRARNIASTVHTPKKPVSLSKTKSTENQKPLYINAERIVSSSNRDRRLKINTLDVLKHLVQNFEPRLSGSKTINETLIHDEFKNHVLHHLGYLFDAHASINDISQEINEVQKRKTHIRNKIFEIKKNHAEIGTELNKLRTTYQDEKTKFENFSSMNDKLQSISNQVKNTTNRGQTLNDDQNSNISDLVEKDLFAISKIVNPNSGIFRKLTIINNRLSKIDSELS